ncbi:MAG: response regulator transcription factor [Peptostreptococcaceae bacterium]|nr:response regulator transcription factor [Peptostreptococcaceae bacterium]
MNVLIVANSLIIKESISNIFKKVYNGSNIKITNKIDNLSIDEINFYDMILVNIVKNDLNFFNKVIQLKNNKNKIVILDQLKNDKVLKLCIEKNIDGYVVDFEDEDEFKYIINKIICGKKFYDADVIQKALGSKNKTQGLILTPREEEVMLEVKKGLSNKEIADKLGITEFTVKKHLSSVLQKLNFKSRKDVIIYGNNE